MIVIAIQYVVPDRIVLCMERSAPIVLSSRPQGRPVESEERMLIGVTGMGKHMWPMVFGVAWGRRRETESDGMLS